MQENVQEPHGKYCHANKLEFLVIIVFLCNTKSNSCVWLITDSFIAFSHVEDNNFQLSY